MSVERFRGFGVVGGGFFFTVTGLTGQFFTLYAQDLGASTLTIGILVTLRAVLPIFIAMPSGELIDRIGPVRMMVVGNAALLGSLLLNTFATSLTSLVLSQVLLGSSIIIMATSLQVMVSAGDFVSRNDYIQRYSMWMSGGGMLGPLVGGVIASQFSVPIEGYRAAFGAAALASGLFMVGLFVVYRFYPHPRLDGDRGDMARLFMVSNMLASYSKGLALTGHRPVQFGLTATFLIMYIQSLYNSFLPLYMDSVGFSTMIISLALALNGLSAMLTRFVLNGLMARVSSEYILTGAGLVAAMCVLLTPLASSSVATMLLNVTVMGGAVGLNLPVSIMIMVDAVGETERGKLMGLRLLVNRFSQVLSPAMFGVLGHAVGLTAAMYCGGAFLTAAMLGFSAYAHRTVQTPGE